MSRTIAEARTEQGKLIANSNNAVHPQLCEPDLGTPRFDNKACANAQPVVPIPTSRIYRLIETVRSTRDRLHIKSKALALVVIAGFAVGALGGTILVKQQAPSTNEASFDAQPVNEEITDGAQGAMAGSSPSLDSAIIGTTVKRRSPRRQRRVRTPGPPRAYQVDVIR